MKRGFEWIEITHKIAEGISKYEKKQNELIEIVNKIKKENDLNEEKIENNSIDPFSVINVLFTRCSDKKRNKLINDFIEINKLEINKLDDDFLMKGIPNLNYTQVRVTKGAENELQLIKTLWKLFLCVLNYDSSKHKEFIKYYDESVSEYKKSNDKENVSKHFFKQISVAMYIIKPKYFIPLDINTTNELKNINLLEEKEFFYGEDYLKLCKKTIKKLKNDRNKNYKTIYEFSHYAYIKNKNEKEKKEMNKKEILKEFLKEYNDDLKNAYENNESNMNDAIKENSIEKFSTVLDNLYAGKGRR